MASSFDLYQMAKEAAYKSIEDLADVDRISWDTLSEWAGYEGPSSLKNIIKQDAHNLEFVRGCMLLKHASAAKNLRVHKHTLDTVRWEIVPRQNDVQATGSLKEELATASKAMGIADDAVEAGNVGVLIQQYRTMQKVMAKMRAEIETLEAKMKRL